MFLLGILGIAQALFLPGLIFHSLFKPKGGFFYRTSVVIAVSMLVNATIIYPLVYLHLYTKTVVLVWVILEVLALLWLYRGIVKTNLDSAGQKLQGYLRRIWQNVCSLFDTGLTSSALRLLRGLIIIAAGGLAVSLVIWFLRRLTNNFGSVFNTWDAVVSWNAWAQGWARNLVPNVHLTYPQLLPLNLSLTYVLTGNFELSLFAKAIMPVFALLTVLTIFELAVEEKKYGYFFAVILVYLLYKKFLGDYISDGYADIPVAFMAFTALVPFLRDEEFIQDRKGFILSVLIAAAAALTKQVGIYILILLPILALLTAKTRSKSQTWRTLAWFGVGILLILPWYLPVGLQVLRDFSQAGFGQYMSHATQVQGSSSPFIRTAEAFVHLGKYFALYIFMLPALFLVNRRHRLLVLLFVLPFSILWGVIASYSERNLSITFAMVAVLTGLGLETLIEIVIHWLDRIKFGKLSSLFLALLILLPLAFFAWRLTDAKLIQTWKDGQSQIFSPEIDNALYALDHSDKTCTKIITNFPVGFLPGFEGMQVNSYFNDYGVYEILIADPGVCWILVPNNIDTKVEAEIQQNLTKGSYQLLFSTTKWVPYRLIKVR